MAQVHIVIPHQQKLIMKSGGKHDMNSADSREKWKNRNIGRTTLYNTPSKDTTRCDQYFNVKTMNRYDFDNVDYRPFMKKGHNSDNDDDVNDGDDDNSLFTKRIPKKMYSSSYNPNVPGDPCRVCGFDRNTGRNFGVITCSTCKAFFRRNGRTGSSLPPCRFGGHCAVNERTRRQCPTCRLAKCFAVGMQKDLIRTDEERAARLQLVKANRIQRLEKSQQRLVLDANETILPTEASPSIRLPTTNDWIQLTNIRNAYEHFCLNPMLQAEEERDEYLNAQPVKCRLKEHSFLNVLNTRLTSLAAFFRTTIPAFSIGMNGNDRQWLIRTNLHYLFLFSSMDLMSINGNQPHFVEAKACHNVYVYVYGQELLEREEYLLYKLNNLIGFDSMISKMMQIILFLSPCLVASHMPTVNLYQPSVETIRHIFQSQEEYTRMLWSYLIYRYGEYKSYKLFMKIIGQVLEHQRYGADVDNSLIERQPFGGLVYSLLTSFSLD
ncbi:unnamed protein product [Adineta ricciae]|uniref:Nuclear receptor domain-containing protein n=1 Tax=Adineta ricciae TaxID=249248 RepID=A0A815D9E6_ADIRI|nr:unnamed protein product [Adineta ricciae]